MPVFVDRHLRERLGVVVDEFADAFYDRIYLLLGERVVRGLCGTRLAHKLLYLRLRS